MTGKTVYPLRSEVTIQRVNFDTLMDRLSAIEDALTLTQVQLEVVTAERDQARARNAELTLELNASSITHSAYEQMRSERNDAQDDLEAVTTERDQVRAWVVGTQAYLWRCELSDPARAWVVELVKLLDTKPNDDE